MSAAYDNYDYPSYWTGREYEHQAELIALKAFLEKIPKIKTALEIGAGYGRLTPVFIHRAGKIIVSDPSSHLLKIARKNIKNKKVKFVHSKIETLNKKIKTNSVDLAIIVRVLHHINDPDKAFLIVKKVLKKGGFLILEFANKSHLKATVSEFFKGNFTFPLEILPKDRTSQKSKKKKVLPFKNYHPDQIKQKLENLGFSIVETRSVSNIRCQSIKRIVPLETLLTLEKWLQTPLSYFNFGPSIFILAKNNK